MIGTATLNDFPGNSFLPARWFDGQSQSSTADNQYWAASGQADTPYRTAQQSDSDRLEFRAEAGSFEAANMRARIHALRHPERFAQQGIAAPTLECREQASEIAISILKHHHLYPERIGSNVEEGITLLYKNHLANRTLVIEVYNTNEIAALINQGSSIRRCEDISGTDDAMMHEMAELLADLNVSPAT